MALIRKLFWTALFILATISFTVLFETGTTDFAKNFKGDVTDFIKFVNTEIRPPKKDDAGKTDKPDK